MPNPTIQLPWGKESLSLTLPETWQVAAVLEPAAAAPVADAEQEVARALFRPVGMPRLGDLVRPGLKVVIVIDDGSRPTPVARILPIVLAEMESCGLTREVMSVVPATGSPATTWMISW